MTSQNLQALLPTRKHGLARLSAFAPLMGRSYEAGRNYDRGDGCHGAVSQLSPYVRRRLLTEEELVRSAVASHGFEGAEKFVQEVFWRTYFKGWLERRPMVWSTYVRDLQSDLAALAAAPELQDRLKRAEAGATGLACFDAWARELTDTGYLHNHARMWFASIWIFTLGLPWRLGADFFLRHLLDGDPASNTLGWRWVAGLHTRGKAYQAQAWNIAKFTDHRFAPSETDLAVDVEALDGTEPEGLPAVQPLRETAAPAFGLPTAFLITEEDCSLEAFETAALDLCAVATLAASDLRSPRPVAGHVKAFEAGALADVATRLKLTPDAVAPTDPAALANWARAAGAKQVATAYAPEGPLRDWLRAAAPALDAAGIALREWRRGWDAAVWPHATAGFFKVKRKIPSILASMEIA